jgi:glycosyltransferase involved in cell wall biosynthesis
LRRTTLFLAPQPYFRLRGICLAQRETLSALAKLGPRLEVLTFPFGEDDVPTGVRLTRIKAPKNITDIGIGPSWAKFRLDLSLLLALRKRLGKGDVETVYACEESVVLAALLKSAFNFRLIYDMDDILSQRIELSGFLRNRFLLALVRRVEAWAIAQADFILTNSADTTQFARRLTGPAKVAFHHHAPPLPAVESPAATVNPQEVLYAGNLEPYQGIDLLLEALARVLAAMPEARCTIIGGEKEQIAEGREIARELGVGHAVSWLGKMPLAKTFARMQSAAVLISPMTQEKAVPMKLYAYMQAGRPIIATDLPNHRPLLHDENAILCGVEVVDVAGALLFALREPEAGEELGMRCQHEVRSQLERHSIAEALRRAFGLPPAPTGERRGA